MLTDDLIELAHRAADLLRAAGDTVAVAEGSAGGLISAALLSVPGASAYYVGGAVVYTMAASRAFMAGPIEVPAGMRGASEPFATYLAQSVAARARSRSGVSAKPARPGRPTATETRLDMHGSRWPVRRTPRVTC